ncbi:MAG: hypothetical protein ACI4RP_09635 [Acutalibacteraceae bacterium]
MNNDYDQELKKLQRNRTIRITIMIICFGIMLFILLYMGTRAYFTDTETGGGQLVGGNLDIELIDKTKDNDVEVTFPPDGYKTEIMPGVTASKIVSVTNVGTVPAWVRIKVEQKIIASNGTTQLPIEITSGENRIPVLKLNIDSDKWYTDGSGYYYYKTTVKPNTKADNLFSTVTFSEEMDNDYKNCTVQIIVSAEAVQSDYNPKPDSGKYEDIAGWTNE